MAGVGTEADMGAGAEAERESFDEIGWAKNRIADNQKKNWVKSNSLNLSFWFSSAAIALNLLTLLLLIKK